MSLLNSVNSLKNGVFQTGLQSQPKRKFLETIPVLRAYESIFFKMRALNIVYSRIAVNTEEVAYSKCRAKRRIKPSRNSVKIQ